MKKIAIIAFGHPESTLPLAKHLSRRENFVDYYYISYLGSRNVPGFNFGGILIKLGISRLSKRRIPDIYNYFNNKFVLISLIGLLPSSFVFLLNKFIITLVGKSISKKKYDVINIVGHHELLIDLHKATKKEKKIHTLHEVIDHSSGTDRYGKLLNYLFDSKIRIIVHSQTNYDKLIDFKKCNNKLVSIIPFGLFETYRLFDNGLTLLKEYPNTILFFGTILPYKGLNVLIAAIEILKSKSLLNFKVIIAGSGELPNRAKLEKDKTYIIINRYISNEEIVALNKHAKLIICPYISASQSGIVMTAFLFHKPIIASDVGAFKETIIDMYNGLLIPPNSAEDLANGIIKLLNDSSLYDILCKNVIKFNESSKFGWGQIAELTFKAYFSQ